MSNSLGRRSRCDQERMTPEQAIDKAFKRAQVIFENFSFG
jgi:hypothetical protein